jgi:hypothetical protein
MRGRVEHIASGRVAHVTSLEGFLTFLTDVLADEAPIEPSGLGDTVGRRPEP